MALNLTEYDLTKLVESSNYDAMLCQWNVLFDSQAIFIFLICILFIIISVLKLKYENSLSLSFFIASGLVGLSGLLLSFINVSGCGTLLSFGQVSVLLVLFFASCVLLILFPDN